MSDPRYSMTMTSTSIQGWNGKNISFIIVISANIPEVRIDTEIFEVIHGFKLARKEQTNKKGKELRISSMLRNEY